jgi:phosphoglycerate dehydrogenase-like enzyme
MPGPTKPRLLVLAPEALFRSFFDGARRRRLDQGYRWSRSGAGVLDRRLREALAEAEGLITTWDTPRFGAEVLSRAPRLRVIGHCGGEVKGRFEAALFAPLTITNAAGPMALYTAELAVTFLLYGARNVDAHRESLRRPSNRVYARIHRDGLGEETVLGRTVGLVGFGRIGRAIAGLLRPFGARLLVFDPYVEPALIRREGGLPATRAEILRSSQHVILAAALTEETRGFLDGKALARLRDGATVVNVARGALLDLDALKREVRRGRLRCALDVTDPEPLPRRHPLRRMRGAILTPHVAAGHREVRAAIADTVLDDLERFFRGQRVGNRVTGAMLERMT